MATVDDAPKRIQYLEKQLAWYMAGDYERYAVLTDGLHDPRLRRFEQELRKLSLQFCVGARFERYLVEVKISVGRMPTIAERLARLEEATTTPEDTLRAAGISNRRQARYQRRMSSLLAGRA